MTAPAPPLPREIQLEVTGACNLACRMCLVRYRPKLGRAAGAMCLHTFRRVVDELPALERITLQGLGEPLLAPDLGGMIEYATARGIRVGFNTNGMLLTPPRARRLVAAGLAWLHVSLDGATAATYESIRDGASFERVCANIRGLVAARREASSELPTVSLVLVAMRRNVRELPALVRLAAGWGVERVWVQNLSHSFSDTDPAGAYAAIRSFAADEALWNGAERLAATVFEAARAEADRLGVELRLPRLVEAPPAPREPGQPACDWPFTSAYVTHDGRVQPCCMIMGDDRVSLGHVAATPFGEIWRGDPYQAFRTGLVKGPPPRVCEGCSLYRRLF